MRRAEIRFYLKRPKGSPWRTFYWPVARMHDEVVTVTPLQGAGPGSPHMNLREGHPAVLQKAFKERCSYAPSGPIHRAR